MNLIAWEKRAWKAVVLTSCLLVCAPLFGQGQIDASRVTPRDLRPEPAPAATFSASGGDAQEAPAQASRPAGADGMRVTPAEVVVIDGFPALAEATRALIEPFNRRRSTVGELYALADALEALYSQAGYPLARVTIPPQEVNDGGDFRLLVIDGYLEAVNLDGVPARLRRPLRATLEPLVRRPRLRTAELERAVIVAGRAPGLSLRSTLVPGEETGASVLVLEAEHLPYSGSVSMDNRLSDTLGPWQSTLQMQLNQPLGRGEQLYAYIAGHPNLTRFFAGDAERRVGGGGISVPLGRGGSSVNVEFTASNTRMASTNPLIPSTLSRFERASLRLSHPLRLSRDEEVTLNGSFEMSRQSNEIPDFGIFVSRDELRVLRLNLQSRHSLSPQAQATLFVGASQGLKAGARTPEDAMGSGIPLSREGSEPDFSKLEFVAGLNYVLAGGAVLASTLRVQHAFGGALPSAELFSLDGEDALSALVSGRLADDGGWTLRNEISRGFAFAGGRISVSPFAYFTGGEPRSGSGAGAGFSTSGGIGLRAAGGMLNLSLEYGRSRLAPGGTSDAQFFANIQVRF